jgi:hypothetical protein
MVTSGHNKLAISKHLKLSLYIYTFYLSSSVLRKQKTDAYHWIKNGTPQTIQMYRSMEQVAAVIRTELNSAFSDSVKYREFQVPSSLDALARSCGREVDADIVPGHDASIAMA